MNRANLIKLADAHDDPKRSLPHGFDMRSFRQKTACVTVCCLLGGATAWFPMRLDEGWLDYSKRVFGVSKRVFGVEFNSDEWSWMFSASWAKVDNTPEGAAARIRVLLLDELPRDWLRQMDGRAPLCYRTPKLGKIRARYGHGRAKA